MNILQMLFGQRDNDPSQRPPMIPNLVPQAGIPKNIQDAQKFQMDNLKWGSDRSNLVSRPLTPAEMMGKQRLAADIDNMAQDNARGMGYLDIAKQNAAINQGRDTRDQAIFDEEADQRRKERAAWEEMTAIAIAKAKAALRQQQIDSQYAPQRELEDFDASSSKEIYDLNKQLVNAKDPIDINATLNRMQWLQKKRSLKGLNR